MAIENIEKLVEQVKQGDQKAFNKLVVRYKSSLLYTIEKLVKNHEDAEDIMLVTFSKAYFNIHEYNDTYTFSTWLFKIATNAAIDFLRKKNNLHSSLNNDKHKELDAVTTLLSDGDDPEITLERLQKIAIIRKLVSKLDIEDRQFIYLRYTEELTYEEIAEKLGMPLGTVKVRLFRIRKLLLRWIEKYYHEV